MLAAAMLALCAALPAGAAAQVSPATVEKAAAAAASRQLLVMLRLPPQHFHPDAAYAGRYPDDGGRAARRRAGQELARKHGLKLVDDWPMPVIGIDCYVMEQAGDAPLEPVLEALARDPRVAWAQPMNTYQGLAGDDPLYPVQPAAKYWKLAQLHKSSTGRGVRVAVIDSGIDAGHPDLAGQVRQQQDFVGSPAAAELHGTAVAGIIAARAGNGLGIAGIAPDARVLALRACWTDVAGLTRCNSFTLGKALNFAITNGAKVINLSLSGPADRLLQTLLDTAAARGMVVVGAADPQRADGGFPASYPGVIAVAGADRAHAPAGALLAPGAGIPTTMPGARWGFVSGPSYAAAHVAGLAALLVQLDPSANAAQLRDTIRTAANNAAVQAFPVAQAGNIDACATIAHATGACACSCPSIAAVKASSP
ncbi:S8 family peptidase [Massilia polaris]|nr:S8 family serine peptidase [Massilia polaris]